MSVSNRAALLSITLVSSAGCAALNQTVLHEVSWEPAAFFEVSRRGAGLSLRIVEKGGERWVVVHEQLACVEEATQRGVEVEERKPKDWVLGMGAVLGGSATAAAIGLTGGALTSAATQQTRTGQQTGASQVVGLALGVAGALGQLFAYQKIIEGLNAIRFRRERPLTQELGREVPCGEEERWRAPLAEPPPGPPRAASQQAAAPRA